MDYQEPTSQDLREPKECGLSFIPNVIFLGQRKANKEENCRLLALFLKKTEVWLILWKNLCFLVKEDTHKKVKIALL